MSISDAMSGSSSAQAKRGPTADHAFRHVAEECRAGREPRWFTDTLLRTLIELHQQGWAHSIEVWQDDDLIGGAIGIGIGRTQRRFRCSTGVPTQPESLSQIWPHDLRRRGAP